MHETDQVKWNKPCNTGAEHSMTVKVLEGGGYVGAKIKKFKCPRCGQVVERVEDSSLGEGRRRDA
jgi:hypothetical protein